MAISAATQNDLIELSVSILGRAPGTTLLNTLAGMSNDGTSIAAIADYVAALPEFVSDFPVSATYDATASSFLDRVVPAASAELRAEGTDIIVAHLTGGGSLASLFIQAIAYLNSADGAAAAPASAATFANQVAVATTHSVDFALDTGNSSILTGVTDDVTTVATAAATTADLAAAAATINNVGETFTLTTGADALTSTGGASDESFDASLNSAGNQTLNSLDSINAGEGVDTLNVQLTASASPLSLAGIEKINLTASGAATLNLRNADSVTNLNILGSTANTTVNNVPAGAALAISDTTSNITIGSSGVSGSSDSTAITMAAVTGSADVSLAGIENISINSLSANTIDLVATSAKSLTLSGDSAMTIGNLNTSGATKIYTVDASESTGAVKLTTGSLSGVTPSQDVTITGGSGADDFDVSGHSISDLNVSGGAGNDRITAAPVTTDTLAGGDGTDTLELTAAVAAANTNITGFEKLQLTGNISQDADNISGNALASLTIAATGSAGLTDAPASVATLVLNSVAIGNNTGTITLDRKADTTEDALLLSSAGATSGTVTVNDEEALTVSSTVAASTITTLNAADVTSITVTGTENLTIGSLVGNIALATVDASNSTGLVSVGGTANGSA
jgi:hypothetical protein